MSAKLAGPGKPTGQRAACCSLPLRQPPGVGRKHHSVNAHDPPLPPHMWPLVGHRERGPPPPPPARPHMHTHLLRGGRPHQHRVPRQVCQLHDHVVPVHLVLLNQLRVVGRKALEVDRAAWKGEGGKGRGAGWVGGGGGAGGMRVWQRARWGLLVAGGGAGAGGAEHGKRHRGRRRARRLAARSSNPADGARPSRECPPPM